MIDSGPPGQREDEPFPLSTRQLQGNRHPFGLPSNLFSSLNLLKLPMGYNLELLPNDTQPLSEANFMQRLLDAGLEVHPSFLCEEDPEIREQYSDTLMADTGMVIIGACPDAPCGTSASCRLSWGHSDGAIRESFRYLLDLAHRINASLLDAGDKPLTEDHLEDQVERFVTGRRQIFGHLGTSEPSAQADAEDPGSSTIDTHLSELFGEVSNDSDSSARAPVDPARMSG